jgi:ABC-2 type transport system permease protein
MSAAELWTSFYTILRKDVVRILRIWPQTILPSIVTSVLYFLVFGAFLGSRIGSFDGVPFIDFVVPGLIMLAVVTNSFTNVASVMFSSKFMARNIDEILVSPTPPAVLIAGFVAGGMVRGILVGAAVFLVALIFADLEFRNPAIILVFLLLTSLALSLAGLVNGIYAKSFDGISIVPTFVLAPLIYLGGVFYSVDVLPEFWRMVTHFNPLFYVINGLRYGFYGISDSSLAASAAVLLAVIAVLALVNWNLLRTGLGLRQ